MATCMTIEATSCMGFSGSARSRPPSIDVIASNNVSGAAVCFQIGTPTGDESNCHFIGTPTREGLKLKDHEADECFDCDDSDDDCSQVSDKRDCESEAETEASPSHVPVTTVVGKKFNVDQVAVKTTRVHSITPSVAQPQNTNGKLQAACDLDGSHGYGNHDGSDD